MTVSLSHDMLSNVHFHHSSSFLSTHMLTQASAIYVCTCTCTYARIAVRTVCVVYIHVNVHVHVYVHVWSIGISRMILHVCAYANKSA